MCVRESVAPCYGGVSDHANVCTSVDRAALPSADPAQKPLGVGQRPPYAAGGSLSSIPGTPRERHPAPEGQACRSTQRGWERRRPQARAGAPGICVPPAVPADKGCGPTSLLQNIKGDRGRDSKARKNSLRAPLSDGFLPTLEGALAGSGPPCRPSVPYWPVPTKAHTLHTVDVCAHHSF